MIKKIQHISYCILTTLLMVACQKEELHEGPCKVRFVASVQDEVSVTRDIPEGYTSFTPSSNFQAGLYVSYGSTAKGYTMTGNGSTLSANLWLEAWTDPYWFYGYAPLSNNNAKFNNTTKTLTLSSITALTTTDWLVIKPCSTKITTGDVTSGRKTVTLEMDHLMAKITPCFYLNSEYANLRNIKIKKVEFFFDSAPTHTVTISYKYSDYSTAWSTSNSTSDKTTIVSYEETDNTKLINLPTTSTEYGHFYIVPNQSAANLKMKVTYDVYDKVNNTTPIRSDEVVNKVIIKKDGTTIDKLSAGNNYKLNIQVIPTYLYVLSDNDQESLVIPNN